MSHTESKCQEKKILLVCSTLPTVSSADGNHTIAVVHAGLSFFCKHFRLRREEHFRSFLFFYAV